MLTRATEAGRIDWVDDQVRHASSVTAGLLSDLIAAACVRLPMLNRAGNAGRLYRLIECGAWTDAALALVEIELPQWKLRHLVLEDQMWHCSLSRQVNLPRWLDDSVDASHAVLPLAILSALLEARRFSIAASDSSRIVPRVRSTRGYAIPCDNFS